jgi:hypothetical protein
LVTEDARLIDETASAVASLRGWRPAVRKTRTQLLLTPNSSRPGPDVFVDARAQDVHATCYALSSIPEERMSAVAELINLIACSGVPFTLALDLEHRTVALRNHACFVGVTTDPKPLLRDLIIGVANAPALYAHPLRQIAFELAGPAEAFAAFERRIDDLARNSGL